MKAKFTEQQPAVFWQPVEKKIFVTICLNETETEEEMGETKQTVYEYDCNQIWIQEGELDEVVVVDIFAYRFRSSEVHRSIFDRSDFAGCHEGAVYRSIVICIYIHDVVCRCF